jgi:hypothetical protein
MTSWPGILGQKLSKECGQQVTHFENREPGLNEGRLSGSASTAIIAGMGAQGASSEAVRPRELAVSRYTSVPSAKVSASSTSEVVDRAFDLRVPEENLHCAEIARCLVDDRDLRSAR